MTTKPSINVEKPASILSHDVEKIEATITNKYTAKKNHTISNDPSKNITNSKTKKLKSACGRLIELESFLCVLCLIVFNMCIFFLGSGGYQTISSKAIPLNETIKEIDDDELEKLALTFCSGEILNGMVDANWKTRLSYVQEFSEVYFYFFIV